MFFVFPQAWITPAITAAALAFGPIPADHVEIKYAHLAGNGAGEVRGLNTILIDKRPAKQWDQDQAQCVLVHEYGHLAGREHSPNRNSIMNRALRYKPCIRWLRRHGLR